MSHDYLILLHYWQPQRELIEQANHARRANEARRRRSKRQRPRRLRQFWPELVRAQAAGPSTD